MNTKFLYGTVSSAIKSLRENGFNKDFSLDGNYIVCNQSKFDPDDIKIVAVYRYEGDSDPADEASVYGLKTRTGLKGILVTGGDADAPALSRRALGKLHSRLLAEV